MSLDRMTFLGRDALPPPLMAYLQACPWRAGAYLARLQAGGRLAPEDCLFFLMDGARPVAFCALLAEDCIDDPALSPWVGFVFVDPRYRGRRLSGRLIAHALEIARERGFERAWLATDHVGLYEKYGFVYHENRPDIHGGVSRLYSYDLTAKPQPILRPATPDDLPRVQALYRAIVAHMRAEGLDIWDDIYPCCCVEGDIQAERLYTLCQGPDILAAFALCEVHSGEEHVTWRGGGRAVYLDRLGVSPHARRTGVGTRALEAAMEIAQGMGAQHLRLFAVEGNAPAIALYQACGFIRAQGLYEAVIDSLILREQGYEIEI